MFRHRHARALWLAAFLLLAIGIGIGLWRVSKARCFQLVGQVACRVDTTEKIVALSFDDGPTPEGVDAVLPVLKARNIHATFFLIGKHMAKYPREAKRLLAAGHELGNHSFTHTRMIGQSSADYDSEIAQTDKLLRAAGVAHPVLFRPPFGKRLIGLPLAVERAGYRTIMWSAEDEQEYFQEPQGYARNVLEKVTPGGIILIHPMYRHNQVAKDALPIILDRLIAQGYRIVPVGELLTRAGR